MEIINEITYSSYNYINGVSQKWAPLADRREPAGNKNKATTGTICFWT